MTIRALTSGRRLLSLAAEGGGRKLLIRDTIQRKTGKNTGNS